MAQVKRIVLEAGKRAGVQLARLSAGSRHAGTAQQGVQRLPTGTVALRARDRDVAFTRVLVNSTLVQAATPPASPHDSGKRKPRETQFPVHPPP